MQKRLGFVIFSACALSSMILAACQTVTVSNSSSQSVSPTSSSPTSSAAVDPSWEDDGITYTFQKPVTFAGADSLPTVDHVVAFVPTSTVYKNVYLWSGTPGTLPNGSSNWPGIALSEKYDENWWKVDLPGITATNIIFNEPSPQTADMSITHAGYWWFWTTDNNIHDSAPVTEWVDYAGFTDGSNIKLIASAQITSFKLYEGTNLLIQGAPAGQGVDIALNKHELDLDSGYSVECQLKGSSVTFKQKLDIHEVFNSDQFNSKYAYSGKDLGLTYAAASSSFKVWSPLSTALILRVYDNGTPLSVSATKGSDSHTDYPMTKGDKGVWSVSVPGDLNGKYYTYVVTNASYSAKEVVDPYARAVGINGLRGEILDLSTTDPEGWSSVAVNDYDRKSLTIWECHIADLTSSATWTGTEANRKRYAGFHESGTTYTSSSTTVKTGYDHVKELGVNAVQILPFFDQANDETLDVSDPANNKTNGAFNWGYNPLNYNAPEGIYSSNPYDGATRIKELKALIADYTKSGINIIMDVVYNHVAGANQSNFDVLMPGYYFRYNEEGALSNGSGCGNETASEHYMMRKFIVESASYWAKEYKLGGFRFDLMGLHDLETMNEVAASCKAIAPNFFIHGEPWQGGTSTLADSLTARQINGNSYVGYGQFNDGMRDALIKGGMNGSSALGWITDMDYPHKADLKNIAEGLKGTTDSATIIADPDKTTNYVTCHDNYTLYDRVVVAIGRYDDRWTKQMCTLANAVVFTSQGTSFMLSGDEFARTKGNNSNSYNSSYTVNALDYKLKAANLAMFSNYQKLIALKKSVDGLHLGAAEAAKLTIETSGNNEIVFTIKDTANNKTYKIVHANGVDTPAPVDFTGYSEVYLDTLKTGVALTSSTAIQNYQTLIAVK